MSMEHPMMKCGHAANATDKNGKPRCVICFGITPGADEVDGDHPSLDGREAKCFDCNRHKPSSLKLAFFEHRPGKREDAFYCGCLGWD